MIATATAIAAKTVNVVRDIRTNCFLLTLQKIRELLRVRQGPNVDIKKLHISHTYLIYIGLLYQKILKAKMMTMLSYNDQNMTPFILYWITIGPSTKAAPSSCVCTVTVQLLPRVGKTVLRCRRRTEVVSITGTSLVSDHSCVCKRKAVPT